jgi:hypothetical protein
MEEDVDFECCDNCKHWTCICDEGMCDVHKCKSVWDHRCNKYESKKEVR